MKVEKTAKLLGCYLPQISILKSQSQIYIGAHFKKSELAINVGTYTGYVPTKEPRSNSP